MSVQFAKLLAHPSHVKRLTVSSVRKHFVLSALICLLLNSNLFETQHTLLYVMTVIVLKIVIFVLNLVSTGQTMTNT